MAVMEQVEICRQTKLGVLVRYLNKSEEEGVLTLWSLLG